MPECVKVITGDGIPLKGQPTVTPAGAAANGAAVSGNPTRVAGSDGTTTRDIRTDATGNLVVVGPAAHDAAASGNPVQIGGVCRTDNPVTIVNSDMSTLTMTTGRALVEMPYNIPENTWQYAAATLGIVNTTTGVTVKASAGASLRNYITGLQIHAEALGAATEFVVNDAAAGTVIWRIKIGVGGLVLTNITFPVPLRGSAATLVEIKTLTASVTGAVYCSLQGHAAP